MATKAAKSITINATKYELANALAVNDGKIQLKAKDVVLDEVTPPTPTPPPSAIKLMTVGIDYGSYNKTDILSYSDVFTGTGTNVEINEEKLAAGTVPVIYLVEDSGEDPTTSSSYPKTLCPISFVAHLSGDVTLNFLGVDLYDALSKAVAAYKEEPNAYNRISISADYLAGSYAETGHGLVNGIDNIVSVSIAFNVTNGTVVHTAASARLINSDYNRS